MNFGRTIEFQKQTGGLCEKKTFSGALRLNFQPLQGIPGLLSNATKIIGGQIEEGATLNVQIG